MFSISYACILIKNVNSCMKRKLKKFLNWNHWLNRSVIDYLLKTDLKHLKGEPKG